MEGDWCPISHPHAALMTGSVRHLIMVLVALRLGYCRIWVLYSLSY